MARKHVEDYYTQMTADFKEMKEALQDMEEEAHQKLVSQQMLDNMKAEVAKLKANYDVITYIMYLLNKPQREEKRFSYQRQNKKKLDSIPYSATLSGIREENKQIISNIKKTFSVENNEGDM